MTMATRGERLIVTVGPCECRAVTTSTVRHRDYPEMEACGATATEAAENLANLLVRALDCVPCDDRRTGVEQALADVQDFVTDHRSH